MRAIGVQTTQMRRCNVLFFSAFVKNYLVKVTDDWSKTLSIQLVLAAESHHLEEMTCLTLRGMRIEQAFDRFFQRLELLCPQAGVEKHFLERKIYLSNLNMEVGGLL